MAKTLTTASSETA